MFDEFVSQLGESAEQFPDVRKGGNRQCYSMRDACLSAFGVFFTQSPSFLAYQREMHVHQGRDNAESLFGVGHRQIIFDVSKGDVWSRQVRPSSHEIDAESAVQGK